MAMLDLETLAASHNPQLVDQVVEPAFRGPVGALLGGMHNLERELLEAYGGSESSERLYSEYLERSDALVARAREELLGQADGAYRKRLMNFLYQHVRDRERAEELVQETFLRVWKHLDGYDFSRKFSTWAYTIAGNLARNEHRNRRRRGAVIPMSKMRQPADRPFDAVDEAADTEAALTAGIAYRLVWSALDRLPSHHREVLVLREIDDLEYEAIAERAGVPLGTVKSRLCRARKELEGVLRAKDAA